MRGGWNEGKEGREGIGKGRKEGRRGSGGEWNEGREGREGRGKGGRKEDRE